MKIGIIVDGDAESQALFNLTQNINIGNTQIIKPIYADIQPKASFEQIAKKALKSIGFLRGKNADKIIVFIDREDSETCPTEIKNNLEEAFKTIANEEIEVVVKNRKFENWLCADVEALRKMPKRFSVTNAFENQVKNNKADSIKDAEKLLDTIIIPKESQYHKRKDAQNITAKQNILNIACNSRSFRRFLRLISHPSYLKQSKKPHNDCK